MTRDEFVAMVVRQAEKKLRLPPGWWGTWHMVQGPEGETVEFAASRGAFRGNLDWVAKVDKFLVGKYDSRDRAISKAKTWRTARPASWKRSIVKTKKKAGVK